jgi:hypothetical protein
MSHKDLTSDSARGDPTDSFDSHPSKSLNVLSVDDADESPMFILPLLLVRTEGGISEDEEGIVIGDMPPSSLCIAPSEELPTPLDDVDVT